MCVKVKQFCISPIFLKVEHCYYEPFKIALAQLLQCMEDLDCHGCQCNSLNHEIRIVNYEVRLVYYTPVRVQ